MFYASALLRIVESGTIVFSKAPVKSFTSENVSSREMLFNRVLTFDKRNLCEKKDIPLFHLSSLFEIA